MSPFARFAGALALAGGCALAALASHPIVSWSGLSAAAQTQDDPILFYRDAMGGVALSKTPKKDGMGMDFLPVRRSAVAPLLARLPATPAASSEQPLFWRDPMGGAEIATAPRMDSMGMEFLPVRAADIAPLLPPLAAATNTAPSEKPTEKPAEAAQKRVLYYRNPMGLADVSPVPKKDGMGMDYLPVYEGEEQDSAVIKLPPGKIQRTGVRSETVQAKVIGDLIRAPGTIQLDERRVTIVSTRSTAFIEKVADVTTGDPVHKGQVLFRFFSPEIASAAAQYFANPGYEGARTRLDVLNAPAAFIAEIDRTRKVPLSVSWQAPRDGIVMERQATEGMKADAGQALFKIADLSLVWALVDVAERDYPRIQSGQAVSVHVRGMPERTFTGRVSLIYPQINKETRTARVRVELENPALLLRPDMYVEAEIMTGGDEKVLTVPDSAVIDSGTRKLVMLDLGEGRFEPREVQIGRRGDGAVEIRNGVAEGDRVVTSANFLIDAESNLKAALKSLTQVENAK